MVLVERSAVPPVVPLLIAGWLLLLVGAMAGGSVALAGIGWLAGVSLSGST